MSAVLVVASFEPVAWDWLIWVAMVPFLLALQGATTRRALACGLVFGFCSQFILNHWVPVIVWRNRDWLAFSEALSVVVSGSAWIGAACLILPAVLLFAGIVAAATRVFPGTAGFWLVAPAWCFSEFLRSLGDLGHVWGNLGYSQWRRPLVIQSADLGGVYLTAFLAALTSAAVAGLIADYRTPRRQEPDGHAKRRSAARGLAVVAALAHVGNLAYGATWLARKDEGSPRQIEATFVQESIPIEEKVTSNSVWEALDRYEAATRSVPDSELIVWPETALPTVVRESKFLTGRLERLVDEVDSVVVVGCMDKDEQGRHYNGALLFEPGKGIVGTYYKRHLAPFGERVPYQELIPLFKTFQARDPEFTPGPNFDPVPTRVGKVGVCVCFESMFPSVGRQIAASGAEILVIITNDDWYRGTPAPYEHAAMAAFRAVETRLDVVRAACTGYSCFYDYKGRLLGRAEMMARVASTQTLHLRDQAPPYVRFGDWLPLGSGVLVALVLAVAYLLQRRRPA